MNDNDRIEKKTRLHKVGRRVALVVIALVLFVSLVIIQPAMPDRILLLTGPEGSPYHELGLRYAAELEKRGLDAEVVVTDGGLDNLDRLAAGLEDAVAFAPSAIEPTGTIHGDTSDLVTLGSVGLEPLWLFHRSDQVVESVGDLAGLTVETGGEGTVGHRIAVTLLELNGMTDVVEVVSHDETTDDAGVERLEGRTVDALFVTGSAESEAVGTLLRSEDVTFMSFRRAAAYAARIRGVTTVTVPEGVFDLARDIPAEAARLLATSTGLVAVDGLHPSVVKMMLVAASNVHDDKAILTFAGAFPNNENTSLPLDPAARRYFERGESGLAKFLPYKVTRRLNHLGFVVLPLLTLAVAILKLAPAGLKIYGSIRLTGLFKGLEAVEKGDAAGKDRSELLAGLDRIDRKSAKMFVPRSMVNDWIDFRQFLHDMRERVKGGDASP